MPNTLVPGNRNDDTRFWTIHPQSSSFADSRRTGGGPVVVVVVSARRAKRSNYYWFLYFLTFCILLSSPQNHQKKTPHFSFRIFFVEHREREKDYANDDMPTKRRCFRAVVVLPFVACVVSALVFARPARGFYLPGVAPQGTSSSSLFLGLGSRRPLLVFIIFQRAFVRDDLSRI